ncbi:carbohydrate porin [uncultured Thiodictyon sp.]|uniref:carbohydrate porin n=1 Tax=uncultured Thiodictyon sp. TaxID=1846217 RepID=UPI0025FA1CB9|nr:carbohydrate porin [uncultured Thiodictyon sp.]
MVNRIDRYDTRASRWKYFSSDYRYAFAMLVGLTAFAPPSHSDSPIAQDASKSMHAGPLEFGLQSTYIYQHQNSFAAPYSPGYNSLIPSRERSYSFTTTALVAAHLWRGAVLYVNPEAYQSHVLSDLKGLGGPIDAEQQKGGGANRMTEYIARAFLRQTWNLGGADVALSPGLTQVTDTVKSHRLVVSAGRMSITDIFDTSPIAGDPRGNFMNWSFVTYGGFDYAADLRGYTTGIAIEYYSDDWALRYGHFQIPAIPNTPSMDTRLLKAFGEQVEIEHDHKLGDLPGVVKVLAYRDVGNMGNYTAAVVAGAALGTPPDITTTRSLNTKVGFGIHIEQSLLPDLSLFMRWSTNNGKYEEASFAEIDRQLQIGLSGSGNRWGRAEDNYGIAYAINEISRAHRNYLAAGGLGAFVGDGYLNYRPEDVFEAYYKVALPYHTQLSFDYQNIANPGYNSDRHGPVNVFGVRLHFSYF